MKICGKDMRRQDMTRFRNTGMITEVLIGLVHIVALTLIVAILPSN